MLALKIKKMEYGKKLEILGAIKCYKSQEIKRTATPLTVLPYCILQVVAKQWKILYKGLTICLAKLRIMNQGHYILLQASLIGGLWDLENERKELLFTFISPQTVISKILIVFSLIILQIKVFYQ